jgi:hypothetical protein
MIAALKMPRSSMYYHGIDHFSKIGYVWMIVFRDVNDSLQILLNLPKASNGGCQIFEFKSSLKT